MYQPSRTHRMSIIARGYVQASPAQIPRAPWAARNPLGAPEAFPVPSSTVIMKHAGCNHKDGIDEIKGLREELNESVLIKKKPIYGICAGMQLFATTGYEEEKTKGLNWIPGEVVKLDPDEEFSYKEISKMKVCHKIS